MANTNTNTKTKTKTKTKMTHDTSIPTRITPSTHPTTSSTKGTLYFAFGSNLSTTQMTQRCPSSSTPIAIAKLSSYTWFICGRGYANLIPVPPYHPDRDGMDAKDSHATTVWGVVYLLTGEDDEGKLDGYEGFSVDGCDGVNDLVGEKGWRPYRQGGCAYNKLFLGVEVVNWLVENPEGGYGVVLQREEKKKRDVLRCLVYVDEVRTYPGRIKYEYVRRMSRAVRESIPLGIPRGWVDAVMKQHGIDPGMVEDDDDDLERNKGASRRYLVAPPREMWEEIRERDLGV